MKRKGNLYHLIPEPENLRLAFCKAVKGKQKYNEVIDFRNNFEINMQKLREDLLQNRPDIGHYRFFRVHDPKPRSICAASFPERVLHHAIMNICEPVLESYAIYDSYACRKQKGTRKAIARAQNFSRKSEWYLKLDIRKYFDSVNHEIMLHLLSKRFKERELLDLFREILDTYHTKTGKGLPIGNLISQHLANFYLGYFDHWIKEERKVNGYVRYMDDFILFGSEKIYLKTELAKITEFLEQNMSLTLKHTTQLNRCQRGFPFLGYRVFPHKILLSPRSRKRFSQKFRAYENQYANGNWSEQELVRHMLPLIEFTKGAESTELRRQIINRFGILS